MANRFTEFLKRYEEEFQNAGKELDNKEIPQLTEDLFEIYEKTGSRLEFENVYFERRKFLSVYAILSIMYGRQEDISRLEEVIMSICDEICWAISAHVDRKDDNWKLTIDLFASETAFSLAEIICLLEKKISSEVFEKAKNEIYRRVLNPFMESKEPYAWWEKSNMNWNAVCCGSIGSAAIWLMQKEKEKEKFVKLLDRINASIVNYIDGFSADGVCYEGLLYFTYGMSFFVSYADLMYKLSGGKTNLFNNPKLKNIALFQQKCYLSKNISLSFSDSGQDEKYRVGLTAYLSKRYPGVSFPEESLAAGLESDNCYRYIVLSRDYFWTKQYIDGAEKDNKWHTVLQEAQWSICKSFNDCAMAAKGGNNGELHNHNDVGSFMYVSDGEVILDDLGVGEYTKDYFGKERYEHLCCRSMGHNLPLIDGKEQCEGSGYKAGKFDADGYGRTEIEISDAYGLAKEEKVTRIFLFERGTGTCTIVDEFLLNNEKEVLENLITSYKPKVKGCGFEIQTSKNLYRIKVTGGKDFYIKEETYTDHYGVKKLAWLMRWTITGKRTKMVISKVDGDKEKK